MRRRVLPWLDQSTSTKTSIRPAAGRTIVRRRTQGRPTGARRLRALLLARRVVRRSTWPPDWLRRGLARSYYPAESPPVKDEWLGSLLSAVNRQSVVRSRWSTFGYVAWYLLPPPPPPRSSRSFRPGPAPPLPLRPGPSSQQCCLPCSAERAAAVIGVQSGAVDPVPSSDARGATGESESW